MAIYRGRLMIRLHCLLFVAYLCFFQVSKCAKLEICSASQFEGRCQGNSAIVMESAFYGLMHLGRCLMLNYGTVGCSNDVLHLADRWCSGLPSCVIQVPNEELDAANTNCAKDSNPFMEIEYSCVDVVMPEESSCTSASRVDVNGTEGYLSSYVTSQTGCGSLRYPWLLQVSEGQTINLSMLDFAGGDNKSGAACQQTLGYVGERNLGKNVTICRNGQRRKELYSSETNKVELQLIAGNDDETAPRFLIHYTVVGNSTAPILGISRPFTSVMVLTSVVYGNFHLLV